MSNVSLKTNVHLKSKKSLKASGSGDNKKKIRAPKHSKTGTKSSVGESPTMSGMQSESDSKSELGKESTELKVSKIRKYSSSKVNGTKTIGKIGKILKNKSIPPKANLEKNESNPGLKTNGDETVTSKETTAKKIGKSSKVKNVITRKEAGESEVSKVTLLEETPSGKLIKPTGSEVVSAATENDPGSKKDLSKLKAKKKLTDEPPLPPPRKKKTGASKTFKLMSKEFGANKHLWSDEVPSSNDLNTMFNFPPSVENVKAGAQAYRTRIELAGFSNDNISLDLNGRRLVVIAYRLAGKSSNARKITEIVDIPTNVDLDTLHISRRPDGNLIIEEVIPSLEQV